MPVIKSAKKKLRQDKKRTIERAKIEESVKETIRKAVASPTAKTVSSAVSALDKAAKIHIFHKNKAARIKSRLAHMLSPKKAEHKAHSAGSASSRQASSVQAENIKPKAKSAAKKTAKKSSAKKTK